MTTFLTTQDVQALLHVDKSTVYRMAEDGRLPAVKVGRQWRFPAERMADRLGVSAEADHSTPHLTGLLDTDALRSVGALLVDLYDVMAVVTDMNGHPVIPVVNPCGFYTAIAELPTAAELCIMEWRTFAQRPVMSPRFTPSHLGFHCARTFLWAGPHPVGMVLVGGVTPPHWPPSPEFVTELADAIGVTAADIDAVVDQTFDVPAERQRWMLRTLPEVSDLVTRLLTAQWRVASRLDARSELARPAQNGTTP